MARQYNLISADSHVIEPPDLWDKWLPRKYQDQAPKLVSDGDGGDAWQYRAGTPGEPLGLVTCVGTRPEQLKWTGASYKDNIHPACYAGKERLNVLDVDGIDAEVIYPPQRAMIHFMNFKQDVELQIAGLRAYNDWLAEDFCAADPARLVPVAQMPNAGVERAVAELRRAAETGHRGVIVTAWPSGGDSISDEDDPFWAAAEETQMPISLHLILVTSRPRVSNVQDKRLGVVIGASAFTTVAEVIPQVIVSGVFDRFPKLKFLGVETGVGWVPHLLEMMDDRYWRNRHWTGIQLKHPPSEYWFTNWAATFIIDRSGIALRDRVGVENMMWSTDFPHHGNDWPYSRKTVEEMLGGVPASDRRKIVAENCARLYKLVD
jgi:predicted TIM-barrel fold metal-dependent hydrolase